MKFLIITNEGKEEKQVLAKFSHYVGGATHEFVIHEQNGKRCFSQYRTGYRVTDRAPDSISGCKALLDHLQVVNGLRKTKQILEEQETINPAPSLTKETQMSLEEQLAKNTSALEALTAALSNKAQAPGVAAAVVSEPLKVSAETKKEESAADRKKRLQEEKALHDLAQAEKAKPAAEEKKQPVLDYDKDVKPLIVRISVEKGREKATSLVQRFGCGKSIDLLPDQYADVVKFANEILDFGLDPEAGADDI